MKLGMLSMAIALEIALVATSANAQPTGQDQAAAEGLYAGGKKLMAEGKFAEACPKFEESQRLDPAPGTQFKLGECYEHIGRTASAWALFLNVASAAKSAGMADREKIARDRAAALEPKLSKLVVTVPTPAPGIEVKRDGVVVGPAQYGLSLAIDPGSHAITATAPKKQTWTSTIEVGAGEATVSVPALVDAVAEPTAAPTIHDESSSGLGTQKTLAIVAAGVGVVGVGVGAIFGLSSMSKVSDADGHCTGNVCDATGVGLRDDALSAGNVSTLGFGIGLVGLVGGAVLWFTAPSGQQKQPSARYRVAPSVGQGSASMTLGGAF